MYQFLKYKKLLCIILVSTIIFTLFSFSFTDLQVRSEIIEDIEIPSTPTNLRRAAGTETSVSLAWDASTDNVGVTGYEIYQDGVPINTSNETSYTVTGLTNGTTYIYSVKAIDATGNVSEASNQSSVTVGMVNLLVNAGFESGTMNGWMYANGIGGSVQLDNSIAYEGNYSLKVIVPTAGDANQQNTVDVGNVISGKTYTFSAYVKTSGITGTGIRLRSYWMNGSGAFIWQNNETTTLPSGIDHDWTKLQVTAKAPAGATKLMLIVYPEDKNGQGMYWIDQASVIEEKDITPPTAPMNLTSIATVGTSVMWLRMVTITTRSRNLSITHKGNAQN